MAQDSTLATSFFSEEKMFILNPENWKVYQDLLTKALAPLSPEQLALRVAPHLRSIGGIATHMVAVRARWFHRVMGEGGDDIAAIGEWDRSNMPLRTASELVSGFETTWQLMQDCFGRWTQADLEHIYQGEWQGEPYKFTRQWVVWHVLEHDLHHGGEFSLSLGIHGLPAPDL